MLSRTHEVKTLRGKGSSDRSEVSRIITRAFLCTRIVNAFFDSDGTRPDSQTM